MVRVSRRAALCAAAALSACASPMFSTQQSPCNGGVCFVQIDVSSCSAPGGITANPDALSVDAPNNIEWTINRDGFRFPDNGIVFTDAQFKQPHVTGNGRKFIVRNDHTSVGKFKYVVNLLDGNGTPCRPLDPFVNNK